MRQAQRGFDLVDLLIVIVILGILAAIIIPWAIDKQNRGKDKAVLVNMHTLQLSAEDYGVLNDGTYAHDPAMVRALLPSEGKNFKNPVTGKFDSLNSCTPGSCFYEDSAGVWYKIYGYDRRGVRFPFHLSSGQ